MGLRQPVRLDLHIKNVPTLLVKVFEINTRNFYREHQLGCSLGLRE